MAGPQRSDVPFVLTAGFAVGLGLGWLMFHPAPVKAPPPSPVGPKPEVHSDLRKDAGTLTDVERIFQRWGGYAVWENDTTEIALWSMQNQRHDDYYEVRRIGGEFYFRTLARLTRPVIDHGERARRPVAFTETQVMHDDYHREHPGYDPTLEPVVDLPPRLPEPYERTDPSASRLPGPPPPTVPPLPLLTPGAGP